MSEPPLRLGNAPAPLPAGAPLSRDQAVAVCLSAACAMAMGWGVRGAYGHTTGAMMAGALVALAIGICAGRSDWWARIPILGLLGAIGWAFGGQSSYGILIGYSKGGTYSNSAYGYASLFLIGSVWGGVGAGILSLGFTRARSYLTTFIGPLIAIGMLFSFIDRSGVADAAMNQLKPDAWLYGTYWVKALGASFTAAIYGLLVPSGRPACRLILIVCLGWWVGMLIFVNLAGLRINPPRNDGWAGMVGILVALSIEFLFSRNRAALLLMRYGFFSGGIGFAFGDFIQMVGSSKWGMFGWPAMREFGYWTVMEQTFGLIMGLGVALGCVRLVNSGLVAPEEDDPRSVIGEFSVFVLLVPMVWVNFSKNLPDWLDQGTLPERILTHYTEAWYTAVIVAWGTILLYAQYRHRKAGLPLVPATPLGRGQLLFFAVASVILGGYFSRGRPAATSLMTFLIETVIASLCCLGIAESDCRDGGTTEPDDRRFRPTWREACVWVFAVALVAVVPWITIQFGMKPPQVRFE